MNDRREGLPTDEELALEVMLVFGPFWDGDRSVGNSYLYWNDVWEYLDTRYPMLFCAGEFPSKWTSNANHEAETRSTSAPPRMFVLSSIHAWMKERHYGHA